MQILKKMTLVSTLVFTASSVLAGDWDRIGQYPAVKPALIADYGISLEWDPIPNATHYQIRYENNVGVKNYFFAHGTGNSFYKIPTEAFSRLAWVWISACNNAGCGPESFVGDLTLRYRGESKVAFQPADVYGNSFNIVWNVVEGASYYTFLWSRNGYDNPGQTLPWYASAFSFNSDPNMTHWVTVYACNRAGCTNPGSLEIKANTVVHPPQKYVVNYQHVKNDCFGNDYYKVREQCGGQGMWHGIYCKVTYSDGSQEDLHGKVDLTDSRGQAYCTRATRPQKFNCVSSCDYTPGPFIQL